MELREKPSFSLYDGFSPEQIGLSTYVPTPSSVFLFQPRMRNVPRMIWTKPSTHQMDGVDDHLGFGVLVDDELNA